MTRKRGTITILDTGEQADVEFTPERRTRKPPSDPEEQFVMVFWREMYRYELTRREVDVLGWLAEHMDRQGQVTYRLDHIAEPLGITQQNVWNLIDGLLRKGAVRKVRKGSVLVNPHLMWKGALRDRRAAIFTWINLAVNE